MTFLYFPSFHLTLGFQCYLFMMNGFRNFDLHSNYRLFVLFVKHMIFDNSYEIFSITDMISCKFTVQQNFYKNTSWYMITYQFLQTYYRGMCTCDVLVISILFIVCTPPFLEPIRIHLGHNCINTLTFCAPKHESYCLFLSLEYSILFKPMIYN